MTLHCSPPPTLETTAPGGTELFLPDPASGSALFVVEAYTDIHYTVDLNGEEFEAAVAYFVIRLGTLLSFLDSLSDTKPRAQIPWKEWGQHGRVFQFGSHDTVEVSSSALMVARRPSVGGHAGVHRIYDFDTRASIAQELLAGDSSSSVSFTSHDPFAVTNPEDWPSALDIPFRDRACDLRLRHGDRGHLGDNFVVVYRSGDRQQHTSLK